MSLRVFVHTTFDLLYFQTEKFELSEKKIVLCNKNVTLHGIHNKISNITHSNTHTHVYVYVCRNVTLSMVALDELENCNKYCYDCMCVYVCVLFISCSWLSLSQATQDATEGWVVNHSRLLKSFGFSDRGILQRFIGLCGRHHIAVVG